MYVCVYVGYVSHLFLKDLKIGKPEVITTDSKVDKKLYPKECIERGGTYSASLHGTVTCTYDDAMYLPIQHNLGNVPIMVKVR